MDKNERLQENLVKFRKQAGLSQLELAEKLNYSNKNISKWEKGETTPSVFTLQEIANVYGIKVDDLLNENAEDKQVHEESRRVSQELKQKIFKITMLALANVILFSVASVIIYILSLNNVQNNFNIWLVYLYIVPLCLLSVSIYVRVVYKFVEIFTLSGMIWSICGSLYVALKSYVPNFEYTFIVGAALQFIVICITILVNAHLLNFSSKLYKIFKLKK